MSAFRFPAVFLAIAFLLLAMPAAALENTAVVNVQRIMRDATVAASARDQLKAKQTEFKEQISRQETELQKEDQELAKQRTILAQDAFQERVKTFQKKAAETQKDVQAKRQSLSKAYNQALADIQKKVTDIIQDISKDKKLALVIPTSQVLYFEGSLDITDQVLTRLNKEMPSLKVQF